jgi:hypothetical protein
LTVRRSQNDQHSILVRNTSGITLYAGQLVVWATGYRGKRIGGKARLPTDEVAGVIDDRLPSTGCRTNDMCHIIVKGPCLALLSRVAGEADVAAGDILLAATAAASTQATTAGHFTDWVGTFTATETTDGTAANILMNRIGRAISASTTQHTGAARLVDLNIQS